MLLLHGCRYTKELKKENKAFSLSALNSPKSQKTFPSAQSRRGLEGIWLHPKAFHFSSNYGERDRVLSNRKEYYVPSSWERWNLKNGVSKKTKSTGWYISLWLGHTLFPLHHSREVVPLPSPRDLEAGLGPLATTFLNGRIALLIYYWKRHVFTLLIPLLRVIAHSTLGTAARVVHWLQRFAVLLLIESQSMLKSKSTNTWHLRVS